MVQRSRVARHCGLVATLLTALDALDITLTYIVAALGMVSAAALSQLMELPVGFSLGLIAVGPIIFAVCLLACIVPARRALRVDPIAALRAE